MQLPTDFINRMKNKLGEECDAFLASYDNEEIKSLRLNTLKFNGESNLDLITCNSELQKDCEDVIEKDELECIKQIISKEFINNTVIKDDTENYSSNHKNMVQECFQKIAWVDNGFYYESVVRPGKHPFHEIGAYYIQEASAMAPVSFLNVKPGDKVLDLCAAPGGKSTQIASYLQGKGILITNEIIRKRADILSENIERMGVKNAIVVSEDPRNLEKRLPLFFDKILVDAPCSGEGMFRRGDIAREEWSLENVTECAKRQEWILDCAANMLVDGGRLVYSTCTFSEEEDEGTIKAFLVRHPDFTDISDKMKLSGGMEAGENNVGIRLWPHKVKGEGHYLAVLEKSTHNIADCDKASDENINIEHCNSDVHSVESIKNPDAALEYGKETIKSPNAALECGKEIIKKMYAVPVGGYEKGLNDKAKLKLKPMYDFFKEYFVTDIIDDKSKFALFGENIYLLPDSTPSLSGLKVIRAGLQLGSIVKDRFMPSHSLALATNIAEFKNVARINNDVIYKYLNGETFNYEGENGWYLISYNGMSAGFGKLANGIMKNHYPKGLRKNLKT